GFREELEHILDASPADRRTLMFSATMPRAIETLAKRYQRDAKRVNTVSEQRQHVDIDYRALTTPPQDVENAVFNVLRYYDAPNSIVFCGTRAAVNRMTSRFTNRGLSVVALSGELTQSERSHALQAMRDKRAQVCVATDVAARGIDLPELELVIHADLPRNGEALLHRSGRTGRAGRKGTSVLIVPHKARKRTERLLKDANITANWGDPPTADEIIARDNARLLKDPLLAAAIEDAEREFAQDLLDNFTSEQIAAAFIRLHRKGKGAPEDIAATPPDELARKPRDARATKDARAPRKPARANFDNSVWVKLSVGRKKSAEPRWLLPMLCKAGGVAKAEIGAIRIGESETHVELTPDGANQLFTTIGMDGLLENTIRATRVDGSPNPAGNQGTKDAPAPRIARPQPAASKSQDYAKRRKPRGEEDKPWEQSAEATPERKPRGKPGARSATRPKRKPAKSKPSKTPPQNRNKRKWSPS
ncbi:MAG: helicase-related protein, partial [Pseudomonadota bacterium]